MSKDDEFRRGYSAAVKDLIQEGDYSVEGTAKAINLLWKKLGWNTFDDYRREQSNEKMPEA